MAEQDQTTQIEAVGQTDQSALDESLQSKQDAPGEQLPAQGEQPPENPPAKAEEPPVGDQPEQPSRRMSERFREIYQKGLTDGQRQTPQPDWLSQLPPAASQSAADDDDEAVYSKKDVDAKLSAFELQQQLKEARREVAQQFQDDVRTVETKYPKYRQDSSEFDPQALNESWELYKPFAETLVDNPTAKVPSFAQFIDKLERRTAAEQQKAAQQTKATLDEQASQAALPSTAFTAPSRNFSNLSKSEKEAKLGVVE